MNHLYTPGPWTVGHGVVAELPAGQWFAVGIDGVPWKPVAVISRSDTVTEVDEANARLIAAAPELIAALTDLRRESESFVNLARQRGQDVRPEAADLVRNALATARAAIAKAEGR